MNIINRLNELSIHGTQSKALDFKKFLVEESYNAAEKSSSILYIKSNENFEKFYEDLNYQPSFALCSLHSSVKVKTPVKKRQPLLRLHCYSEKAHLLTPQ